MDAVQLGRFITAGDEGPEVNVRGSRVWQGWDADLAEEVKAVGRGGDTDGLEICGAEASEFMVVQMFLWFLARLGLMGGGIKQ